MKKAVMLDSNDNVTQDAKQAVKVIETEYDEHGHLVKESIYIREDAPQSEMARSTIENYSDESSQ